MQIKFVCEECNYEFKNRNLDNVTIPKRCPYCGTDGKVKEKKHILLDL